MQCSSIYHDDKIIICVGGITGKSECFYYEYALNNSLSNKNNKLKNLQILKKVSLAICDGRKLLVICNNLFILCVSGKHKTNKYNFYTIGNL